MTKSLFLAAAVVFAAAVFAQTPQGNAFQQEGWMKSGVITFGGGKIEGQTGPVLGKPISANEVRTTVQTLSDGSHINRSETDHFYRDGQGRMRTETSTGAIIYDPVAGFTYDLTLRNKTYTKSPIPKNAVTTIAAAAHYSSVSSHSGQLRKTTKGGPEPVTEDLPTQMIDGVSARGTRITITIPSGTVGNDHDLSVVNERWVSDDLKLLVKSSNSDPRFGVTTYELTNILQAPPDPTLFQVPIDYTDATNR